jgi:hypothetical protein
MSVNDGRGTLDKIGTQKGHGLLCVGSGGRYAAGPGMEITGTFSAAFDLSSVRVHPPASLERKN